MKGKGIYSVVMKVIGFTVQGDVVYKDSNIQELTTLTDFLNIKV